MHTESPARLACLVAVALVSTGLAIGCTVAAPPPPAPLTTLEDAPPVQQTDSAELTAEPAPTEDAAPPPASLGATKDAGADAADAAPVKQEPTACIAACEAKYPGGATKAKTIDKCWADNCGSCQAVKGVTLYPAANNACQTGVYTLAATCSQCTSDWCCWAWDACFGDAECKSLNACTNACWK
jgi:hypothetical protein